MSPPRDLLGDSLGDGRVGVSQQQGAVAGHVVDVLVAVNVPLARAGAVGHVQREWLGVAGVVCHTAGK